MPADRTFFIRLAIGSAVLAVLAWDDWRRNGAKATRWREYRFLGLVGLSGAVFGVLVDSCTVLVSREYFELAKGLDLGVSRWPILRVAPLGAAAGWTGGLVVGLVLLVANNPGKVAQLEHSQLARYALPPVVAAGILAPGAAVVAAACYAQLFLYSPVAMGDVDEPGRLSAVWGAHLGVYLGASLGVVWAGVSVRRRRKRAG